MVLFCIKAVGFVFFVILCFINNAVARQGIKSKLCVILWFDSSLHRLCDIPPSVLCHAISISDWIHKILSDFQQTKFRKTILRSLEAGSQGR